MTARRVRVFLALLTLLLLTAAASAQGLAPAPAPVAPSGPSALLLDAVPLLGPGSPAGERWLTTVVRLVNTTDQEP